MHRYWAVGLEGKGLLSLQSFPADSQAMYLLPCFPTTSSAEHRIMVQGVRGNKRTKYNRLCKKKNVFLTLSSHVMDVLCCFLELKSEFLET